MKETPIQYLVPDSRLGQKRTTRFGAMMVLAALALTLGTGQVQAQRPLGIDVSRWQGTVNWTSVKNGGYKFAWAQATRGNYLTNNNYVANMINGKAAGVMMAPYHYATPATNSAVTEANYFWNRAGAHILADGKTLMPMLDIEEWNGHVGASSYSEWANQWANWVVNKAASNGVNIKIVLYSSASFMCNFNSTCTGFGSWVANYGGDPQTGTPWSCCTSCNLWGGGSWNFWQYSSTGSVPGVTGNCDLDVFNGTYTQLTNTWRATAMTAAVISGVSAANVSDTGATITWTTDKNSDTVVNYGLTTSYGSTVSNGTMVASHSINLSGLSPSTTYHFRVRSKNAFGQVATSGDFTFTTLAAGQVNDIIIDNVSAVFTGSWSTGSSATDKYATDYRYKGQGTGTAYADFTPNILTAGSYHVYEWHNQGSNRGIDTPHVVTHSGGTATVNVNQQANGGAWNLLGTYSFAAGTAGKVRITDAISVAGQLAMADAIKFEYVPPVPPPTAPSGLSATAASTSQINLSWTDNSSNENGFRVERSTDNVNFTQFISVGANSTSTFDSGLAAATTYYYRVRAYNGSGNSAYSATASATTLSLPPPTAPSGLSATAVSTSQINLAWTDNSSDETSFIVGRSTTSGGPYTDIVTLGANVTSYNNTGLSAATTYHYVVRAANANGASANSAQASATTQSVAPPAAPSGLSAIAISQSEISLSWTDNSSTESNFIIGRSTVSGGPYTDIATVAANTTAYSNTGLSAATTYYYVVRASNAGGASANSAQASAATLPNPPTAPSGLSATAVSTSQINLAWTDNASNEANFIVGRSTTSGGPYTDIATVAANSTAYSNTGLSAATTYYYVVRASNAGGSSGNSAQASATTQSAPPAAPSGLSATAASSTQINLSWTDNSANEVNFIIGRSTTSGGPYTDIVTLGANVTSYNNTGLNGSTTYYYVVRAANAGGSSVNSAQASATTQPVADILIDNTSATVTGTWSTGTSSTDKYQTNYRYKSGGTGAAYLTFTPTIAVAGNYQVYEWHPQGSNRPVAAPHVINYNGGSATVNVNQTINGGAWRLLGTYNFAAGTGGNVRVTDNFVESGKSVMADGIRFVYVP